MGQVKLILRESMPSLGEAGDLVSVKPGYARNYLIPQGKAIFATESNVQEFEHHKRVVADKVSKELKELGAVKARIESLSLEVKARVGEEIADCLIYLIRLCERLGIDPIDAAYRKVEKNEARALHWRHPSTTRYPFRMLVIDHRCVQVLIYSPNPP